MELIGNIISWIGENGLVVLNGVLAIVGGASVLAKLTPTPKDDAVLAKVKDILNKVALNPLLKK